MKKSLFSDMLKGPVCFYVFGDVFFCNYDFDKEEMLKKLKGRL